ncbi:MAG: hypothetical protein ACRC4Z_03215, partial [Fusobacteriaceae bacterium]
EFYLYFVLAFILLSLFMGEMAVVALFSTAAFFFLFKMPDFRKSTVALAASVLGIFFTINR